MAVPPRPVGCGPLGGLPGPGEGPSTWVWQREDPVWQPMVEGLIPSPAGPVSVRVLLDGGASHCFISDTLAHRLALPPSVQPGPASVTMAVASTSHPVAPPVLVPLQLGLVQLTLSASPLPACHDQEIILGWDWLVAHRGWPDGGTGRLWFQSPAGPQSLPLLPLRPTPSPRAPPSSLGLLVGAATVEPPLASVLLAPPSPRPARPVGPPAIPVPQEAPPCPSPGTSLPPPMAVPGPAALPPPLPTPAGSGRPAVLMRLRELRPLLRTPLGRHSAPAGSGGLSKLAVPEGAVVADGLAQRGVAVTEDGTEIHALCARLLPLSPEVSPNRLPDDRVECSGEDHPALHPVLQAFSAVLAGPPPGLPPARGISLQIDTGSHPMPRTRPLPRISAGEMEELRVQLDDLLARGWIRPSTAGHAAMLVFVRKPSGQWRICFDYRGLNSITVPQVEPLPHIDQLLDQTKGATIFSKLDLASAYHQIQIQEADRWKTSFRSALGQFEWNVVPFGLQGAPSILMRVMRASLSKGLDGRPGPLNRCCIIFMDDILIFSESVDQHVNDVREVLGILQRDQLYAQASKCAFGREELLFLGHSVSGSGIRVDSRKIDTIRAWPVPSCPKEVRSFVGLANYYRRFVEGFSDIARPLTQLQSPSRSWHWGQAEQRSFDTLKALLTSAPVLRPFDPLRRPALWCDASSTAVAQVLTQPDDQGLHHPIAFESRRLTPAEQKKYPHELELLSVMHGLRTFRHYLLGPPSGTSAGSTSDFTIFTDNQAVAWLQTKARVSRLHAQFMDELAEFRFEVTHVPGARNPADPVSRMFRPPLMEVPEVARPVLEEVRGRQAEIRRSSRPGGLLWAPGPPPAQAFGDPTEPPLLRTVVASPHPLVDGDHTASLPALSPTSGRRFLSPAFITTWQEVIAGDPDFGPLYQAAAASLGGVVDRSGLPLPVDNPSLPPGGAFLMKCGLLFRRRPGVSDRLCVPAGGDLRSLIIRECHDTLLGGHFGVHNTVKLVSRVAFWPGLEHDVKQYVQSCDTCQRVKADHGGPRGLLHPLPPPSRRGGTLGLDFLCGLPRTADGFDQLFVVVDLLSGKVHAVPCRSTDSAHVAAEALLQYVLSMGTGVPNALIMDQDPKFRSQFFQLFVKKLGSSLVMSSAYHKNTNAKVERMNGVLGDTLRAYSNLRRDDWDQWVPYVYFAINNAPSVLGGSLSPFYIDRGEHPRLPLSFPDTRAQPEDPVEYSRRMKGLVEEVRGLLVEAQAQRKRRLDPHRVATSFQLGDLVLLRTTDLRDPAEVGKLRDRFSGPFPVVAVGPAPNTFTLGTGPQGRPRGSATVNIDRLKPYFPRASASLSPPLSSPTVILRYGRRYGKWMYLLRPQGSSSLSWVLASSLSPADPAVVEFRRTHPVGAGEGAVSPPIRTGVFGGTPPPLVAPVSPSLAGLPSPGRTDPSATPLGGPPPLGPGLPPPPSAFRVSPVPVAGRALPLGTTVWLRWSTGPSWVLGRVAGVPSRRQQAAGLSVLVSFRRLPRVLSDLPSLVQPLSLSELEYGHSWVVLIPCTPPVPGLP